MTLTATAAHVDRDTPEVTGVLLAFTRDELHDTVDDLEELVPLGFPDFPAAASLVRKASDYINDVLVLAIPDDICGDVDLLEMVTDLRLIAERLQGRANGARQ